MKKSRKFLNLSLVMLSVVVLACLSNQPKVDAETADTQEPVKAEAASTTGGGSITGKIIFEGTAPTGKPLNMGADPVCAQAHTGKVLSEEVLVAADKGLKNVLVYLTEGVSGTFPTPEAPVVLDQNGCMYHPRVQGLFDGQALEIRNSDKTLHNVHCYKGTQTCFNRAMFQGMPPIKHQFTEHGEIVKFKCDVHPWMTAYILVADNPFFGVTAADGTFKIENVPAGTYTLKAWHEKYGAQTQQVTVKGGEAATVNLTVKPSA